MNPQSQQGIAAVECVIVLVPLLTLMLAGLECALALQRYQLLQSSVFAATRYLSMSQAGDRNSIQSAQCLVVTGVPNATPGLCTNLPIMPNLSVANVRICDVTTCSSRQQQIGARAPQLNVVTVSTQDIQMTDWPGWLDVWVFPQIQFSMVQISS